MFPFLTPEIQRTIHGFDRGRRRSKPKAIDDGPSAAAEAHLFDKRRLHYLRFGHSDQRHITKVRDRLFWPLYSKSRDELEQYFMVEERRLRTHERPFYNIRYFRTQSLCAESGFIGPAFLRPGFN